MRFIIINSTKYLGKFSIYDTILKKETPCYNLATARECRNRWNKENTFCLSCECDPCDCHN